VKSAIAVIAKLRRPLQRYRNVDVLRLNTLMMNADLSGRAPRLPKVPGR